LFNIVTANLGQALLSRVPYLIGNFLITVAILKKLLANLLRNIAIFQSQLNVPHFLLEVPHFLLEVPRVLISGLRVVTYRLYKLVFFPITILVAMQMN
jgi:hypothetical protein